ncbi:response regulator transcription factor [Alicyclobacillus cycloheptanicus]|uniref:Two-component system response regulator ResD n=1 Tax=Alicyclobacillus cycloheptanicus TaxID=1457 RepID=A0ABT9XM36_9BACL|nr:response regulator transcription factor [Alicyclobacillus cycloheptanicus]MDQ0191379.1 two-component system response regulator ResD [Alicyclobacillus cycloheptanicus]WDM02356.1 response regulator transcription factor [Alicyclobacillus cycloheptanicus]
MKQRILVIEDDENIRDVCRRYMEREGYEVLAASDGYEGSAMFQRCETDLVVVDIMLPGKDGYELCQEIRQQADTPIIILTARGDERDRLMGLTLGADDYLTKPFSPRELMLRIHNVLRRVNLSKSLDPQDSAVLSYGRLTIDLSVRRVMIAGQAIDLTAKEFEVLCVMARRPGQVFSKGQLLDLVWGYDNLVNTSAVTVLIRRLREKIETNPSQPVFIRTVWGIGYRFEPSGEGRT